MACRDRHPETAPCIRMLIGAADQPTGYRVAGVDVLASRPLRSLAPFDAWPTDALDDRVPTPLSVARRGQTLYAGPGWLGGRWRRVHCVFARDRFGLRIEGLDPLAVVRRRDAVELCYADPDGVEEPGLLDEALLGPALMLGLAWHGVFALHASAVEIDGMAFAFLGPLGAGDATATPTRGLGRPIAADILPWSLTPTGHVDVRPWFPQRESPVDRPSKGGRAEHLRLAGIFLLDGPSVVEASASAEELTTVAATITLARHTVSARLFCPMLLRRQVEMIAQLARQVPVVRLGCKRRRAVVPAVHRFIDRRNADRNEWGLR